MIDWLNPPKDISKYQGFVYIISNNTNGKKYIGVKTFWLKIRRYRVRKPTKVERERLARYKKKNTFKYKGYKMELKVKYEGRKKVKLDRIESDWKTYNGSCKELLQDIAKGHEIQKEILHLCETKFDCAYQELQEQMDRKVLFDHRYYNEILNIRLRRKK